MNYIIIHPQAIHKIWFVSITLCVSIYLSISLISHVTHSHGNRQLLQEEILLAEGGGEQGQEVEVSQSSAVGGPPGV